MFIFTCNFFPSVQFIFSVKFFLIFFQNVIDIPVFFCYNIEVVNKRGWRNRQTRTFEGRVVFTLRVQVSSLAPTFFNTAGWCKGSTSDSDSLCTGSNPVPAATSEQAIHRLFFCLHRHPDSAEKPVHGSLLTHFRNVPKNIFKLL